jgi:hypothetical protein
MKYKLLLVAMVLFATTAMFAEKGRVAKRVSGCDYYAVYTPSSGYAVLEWYGGADPDEGDTITGSFRNYGFHTFFVNSDSETRAYVEDWGLSLDDALEKLSEECD